MMPRSRSSSFSSSLAGAALLGACANGVSTENAADRGAAVDSAALSSSPIARITIDSKRTLAVLAPIAVGANAAAWDDNLVDAAVPGLLSDAGIRLLRYPGGSTSDNYHW